MALLITNWGRFYKLGQTLLQIGTGITNWDKLLQIRAQHCNLSSTIQGRQN